VSTPSPALTREILAGRMIGLAEVARRIPCSHVTAWYLVKDGKLEAIKIGRDHFTTLDALERYRQAYPVPSRQYLYYHPTPETPAAVEARSDG
jgi:hypothetical protein